MAGGTCKARVEGVSHQKEELIPATLRSCSEHRVVLLEDLQVRLIAVEDKAVDPGSGVN